MAQQTLSVRMIDTADGCLSITFVFGHVAPEHESSAAGSASDRASRAHLLVRLYL